MPSERDEELGRSYWQQVNVATPRGDLVSGRVALEVQQPWSELVLTGAKAVETRSYPFPLWLIGEKIWVLQSSAGTPGVSSVPDFVWPYDRRCSLAGYIVISDCIRYPTRASWEADTLRHCVPVDEAGAYGWSDTRDLYGWVVESFERFGDDAPERTVPALCRVHRSFFAEASELPMLHGGERPPPVAPDLAAHGPFEALAAMVNASADGSGSPQSVLPAGER